MKALELYKLLPMKNCGECKQKLCMPFAFAVTKGEADISDCTLMNAEEIAQIRNKLVISDWRENLIAKLKEDMSNVKFTEVAEGIGGVVHGESLILKCLGREFSISPKGEIYTSGHINPWEKIFLLNYIKNAGKDDLTNRWVSFSALNDGMLKSSTFERECEEPLNNLFNKSMEKTTQILQKLGALKQDGFATEHAWVIFLLPKIPVLILYWQAEDDIPSQTKILFDPTADRFLDVESLLFLAEGLVTNIENSLRQDPI